MRFPTLPDYDERWFEDVHAIYSVESARPRDKVMTGMLASLGIKKGKPYNPDAKTKKAMRPAATDAYKFHLQWLYWCFEEVHYHTTNSSLETRLPIKC